MSPFLLFLVTLENYMALTKFRCRCLLVPIDDSTLYLSLDE